MGEKLHVLELDAAELDAFHHAVDRIGCSRRLRHVHLAGILFKKAKISKRSADIASDPEGHFRLPYFLRFIHVPAFSTCDSPAFHFKTRHADMASFFNAPQHTFLGDMQDTVHYSNLAVGFVELNHGMIRRHLEFDQKFPRHHVAILLIVRKFDVFGMRTQPLQFLSKIAGSPSS